jgi:hypothetical protein
VVISSTIFRRKKTSDNGQYPLMPQMAPDGHLSGTVPART